MTIVSDTRATPASGSLSRRFYNTAWRWHFYAGLYVAPFLIMLAVTGLIMLWSAVLVGRDGEKAYSVTPAASRQSHSTRSAFLHGFFRYLNPRMNWPSFSPTRSTTSRKATRNPRPIPWME